MLGKFFKKIKDVASDLSPFAGVAASAFGLGPLYSTLIGAGVPLLAGKGGREALAGGIGGYFGGQTFGKNTLKDVITDEAIRKAAGERFKQAAIFESLGENNPLRNLPGVLGGSAFLYGLGAFDTDQAPSNLIEDFTYNPADNKLITSGVSDKFLEDAQQADRIGNNPGDIYEFLRSVGLLNSGGNTMKFDDGKGTVMGMTPTELSRMPTTEEIIESSNRIAQMEGQQEYEAYLKRLIEESIKKGKPSRDTIIPGRGGKGNFATGGGIGDLMEPSMMGGQIGGDRVNPIGGRLVGMGAGREDLLEGEIVDPNTGQTQEILVSNNEHVIPEYTLFALGGGDTEKGQQMMDNLRAETKPMAKQMGYDFQGAEDGSMNYNPVMAKEGKDTDRVTKLIGLDRKSPEELIEIFNEEMKKRGNLPLQRYDQAQDGRQTAMAGPGMNLQEIIKKMMAQGKSIEEIMAIMSKLNMGMPKQRPPMALAQDGMGTEEINGLKKMGMQDGTQTSVPHRGSRLSRLEYPKNFKGSFFGGGANMSTYDDFQDPEILGPGRSPTILERLMNKQGVGFDPKGVVKDPEEFNTAFLKSGLGKMVRDLDQANQIASQI
tara:strand:+ start:497 stop:2299 length:1803 start_codon:yes stop_codon:yes gene_type:complete